MIFHPKREFRGEQLCSKLRNQPANLRVERQRGTEGKSPRGLEKGLSR